MRRGIQNPMVWSEDGCFVGVCLGADFTAEHEFGIKRLKQSLNIDDSKMGADGCTAHCSKMLKKNLTIFEGEKYVAMIYRSNSYDYCLGDPIPTGSEFDKIVDDGRVACGELSPKYDSYAKKIVIDSKWEFTGAWDDSSFGILVPIENRHIVDDIHEAMQKDDLMVFIGACSNPFGRGGLCLSIRSRVPQAHVDHMLEVDLEERKLQHDAEATSIAKKLTKAGKRWYALSPKRPFVNNGDGTYKPFKSSIREKTNTLTKYNVMFWLYPMEQKDYNAGWFTVEQLEEWAQDKGPVVKACAEAKA